MLSVSIVVSMGGEKGGGGREREQEALLSERPTRISSARPALLDQNTLALLPPHLRTRLAEGEAGRPSSVGM